LLMLPATIANRRKSLAAKEKIRLRPLTWASPRL
jgi:hypothetical protein